VRHGAAQVSVKPTGSRPTVVVVGAGMAGLTAARRLQQAGVQVTVLERDSRVGGRVRTDSVHGFQIEAGAGFITNYYGHTLRLVRELGLELQLAPLSLSAAILRRGRLHPVWPRRYMLMSGLIPLRSKLVLLKAGWPVLRHWDELQLHALQRAYRLDTASAAEFARRHLNDEVADYILEPVLGGFLYTTPERTSRALLLVLLKLGLRLQHLFTLSEGLSRLPEAIAAKLAVSRDAPVLSVREQASGGCDVVAVVDGRERRLRADGVVCATTASVARRLVADLSPGQKAFFEEVSYAPNATTAIAIDHRLPAPAHGVLFPRRESRYLATAAVQSTSDALQPPARQDMVMLYPSGMASSELLRMEDAAIVQGLLSDLRRAGPPFLLDRSVLFHRVYRWEEAVPEFGVGYVHSLRRFAQGEFEFGRIVFAGDYLAAPMVEGAVTSGLLAAERLLERLGMGKARGRPGSTSSTRPTLPG
jgi:protoporphyrinogen/coproporphyrinogen III oxidase